MLLNRPTFNSLIKLCFLSFILLISLSSQHLALNLKSLDPPEITPDLKNKVPSRATVWKKKNKLKLNKSEQKAAKISHELVHQDMVVKQATTTF